MWGQVVAPPCGPMKCPPSLVAEGERKVEEVGMEGEEAEAVAVAVAVTGLGWLLTPSYLH